jgi:pSer/pThr/pTyr-binding forkhead associated (FHA) protein
VVEGPDQGLKFEVVNARTIIGRKNADLKLNDPTVSGKHAFLEHVGGKLFVTDNKSTNGTNVNGEKVESGPVYNLDEIKVGDTRLLLSVVEDKYGAFTQEYADEDSQESRVEIDESTMVTGPLPNPEVPSNIQVVLEVIEGADKGKKFKVAFRSSVIGRGQNADFQLDDIKVSNRHCQLEVHNKDKMTIKDLASSNGTRLNNRYVSAVKIRHGDLLQVGDTKIKLLINIRT